MHSCVAVLANDCSKQPEETLRHWGGCSEERTCSCHPAGLGHLNIGLMFPYSLREETGGAKARYMCVHRKGTASTPAL